MSRQARDTKKRRRAELRRLLREEGDAPVYVSSMYRFLRTCPDYLFSRTLLENFQAIIKEEFSVEVTLADLQHLLDRKLQ